MAPTKEAKNDAERIGELQRELEKCQDDLERTEMAYEKCEAELDQAQLETSIAEEKANELRAFVQPLVNGLAAQFASPDPFTCAESRRLLAQCENAGYLPRPVSFPAAWSSAR